MTTCEGLVRQQMSSRYSRIQTILLVLAIGLLVDPKTGWTWGSDGHQIVAYIAADHLTPAARHSVARILGVDDQPAAVADAMARAAVRPDLEFRISAPESVIWHYVNYCRQDTPTDERARCSDGNCAIARIDRFLGDLRSGRKDGRWDSAAQLAFVINLVGELHQPLHAITNADMGGMCIGVISPEPANALHSLWGERLVKHVEQELQTKGPAETARALERRLPDTIAKPSTAAEIAWESHKLAEREIYKKLDIPVQPCQPTACIKNKAALKISEAYLDQEWMVVAQRLTLAGYRLASFLNESLAHAQAA